MRLDARRKHLESKSEFEMAKMKLALTEVEETASVFILATMR